MPFDFIDVNNSIKDYRVYVKDTLLKKKYVEKELIESLIKEGFIIESIEDPSYSNATIIMHEKDSDLLVKIEISKKSIEKFV